jgi:hypothetical protein
LFLCLTNWGLRHEGIRMSGCMDPYFLHFGTTWGWVASFTPRPLYPGEHPPPPVRIGQEAGWAAEPVWTTWRKENSWPYRDSISDPTFVQLVLSRYIDCAIAAPCLVSCTKTKYGLLNSVVVTGRMTMITPWFPCLSLSLYLLLRDSFYFSGRIGSPEGARRLGCLPLFWQAIYFENL